MAAKQTKPKILKVVRTDAFVLIRQETSKSSEQSTTPDAKKPGETKTKLVTSMSEFEEKAHEAPLPAFDNALQALAPVAAKILQCGPDWKDGVTIVSVSISYTESNVRSAVIGFVKSINTTASLHPMKTPAFQIDDAKTNSGERRQCTPGHADAVIEFIKQAQRYAAGERSQQLLNFEEGGDDDDKPDNVELPGMKNGDEGKDE